MRGPVLITGCSSGIGRKITEFLATKDILVYATARKQEDIENLAKIKNVRAFKLDVTRPREIQQLSEKVEIEGNGLYGLINNAGILDIWPILATTEETLHQIFDVNVYGPHRVTKALIPYIIESKGRIINISSASGLHTPLAGGAYSMSKFSIEAFSNALMHELKPHGVKVSIIEPTSFKTKIIDKAVPVLKERKQHVVNQKGVSTEKVNQIFKREIAAFDIDQFNQQWLTLPPPEKVVEVCWDALFGEHPKKRYFVTVDPNVFRQGLKSVLNVAAQIFQSNEHEITEEDLHNLLDSVLNEEDEYVRSSIDWEKVKDE
jgi:short-subunit dehydrogenase